MQKFRLIISASILANITVISLLASRQQIACGLISVVILGFLIFIALFMYLVTVVLSLIYFSKLRTTFPRSAVPLALNILTLLVVFFFPPDRISLNLRFLINANEYSQVVNLVEKEILRPNEDDPTIGYGYRGKWVELPQEYQHLSNCGGAILVDTSGGINRIFFFTYRDIFLSFAGYMYRSSGQPEQKDFDLPLGRWYCDWQEQAHWYFCSHPD